MLAADKLEAIVKSKSNDPRILAELAGGDPRSFYRGANFNNADLRGVDLRGYNLTAATFENAWLDRNTRVDEAYIKAVGLERRTIVIRYLSLSSGNFFPKLHDVEGTEHLGDIIDEVIKVLESKLGNLERVFSENMDDKSRVVRGRGNLVGELSTWGFLGGSIFSRALANSGPVKAKSIFSAHDFGRNVNQQPPVNLFASDKNTSKPTVEYKAKKNTKWPPINEAASPSLLLENKNLEVALLLSTHKKLVALSGITKADLETLAAQFLHLSSYNTSSKKRNEAMKKELEAITS